MASVVQICNIALSRIGQTQFIDSLTEQSKAAELCDLHYDACREEVLQAAPWPFAEARVYLADIGSPPVNWLYRYRYPTDCLQAQYISLPGMRMPSTELRPKFKVINASGGRAIVADMPQAELVYTVSVEDTTYFPPLFVSALAWRVAAELAMGLQARPENYAAAMQNYSRVIDQAQAQAFNESDEDELPESEFVSVRN
ncbi:hypothetical protein [Pseudomonas segetis]|uniref:Uncharacterized protein n=1 Tax=Pseudomonas segetis TaxID=298908 RepID=A0A239C7E0_9PSED|nr:hypothetical protein [Pseudomonas segetis]SNS15859.1 hypothetical protein SAMN05216255_1540 [Pseudomonas segetis]